MQNEDFNFVQNLDCERDHFVARITAAVEQCGSNLERIADQLCPPPDALVGTQYIAAKLGITIERVSQMARYEEIPSSCIVDGTGHGKPWKFHRCSIENWIRNR